MSPECWAQCLIISPIIGILCLSCTIYVTTYEDSWRESKIYEHAISQLGSTWSQYRIVFALGFTVTSILIVSGYMVKIYLIRKVWQLSCLLMVNMLIVITAASTLTMMAWTPDNVDGTRHWDAAVIAISSIVLSQLVDTLFWYKYSRFMRSIDAVCCMSCFYAVSCSVLSFTFFGLWLYKHEPWCEWMGLLFALLGFLNQSIHGIALYKHIRRMGITSLDMMLLINDKIKVSISSK
eukprot:180939_1